MIVSNTSPLIYLAKLGKLELLKRLFNKIIIPWAVYEEVVLRGKERGFIDATIIENAINNDWIEVKKIIAEDINLSSELDAGESEAIQLAKELNASLLLIDDAPARTLAESFGLSVKGTLYVLTKSYKKELINKSEIKNLLSRLISLGFRISPEIYGRILEEIDK